MGGKGWCVRGRGEEGSGGCDRDEMEGEGEKHKTEAMMEGCCLCEGSYTKEMHSGRG